MKITAGAAVGAVLVVSGLAGCAWSLHELFHIGTCVTSSTRYTAIQACPAGAVTAAVVLTGSIIAAVVGIMVASPSGWGAALYGLVFVVIGLSGLYAAFVDGQSVAGARLAGGIIGLTFVPIGLVPLVLAIRWQWSERSDARPRRTGIRKTGYDPLGWVPKDTTRPRVGPPPTQVWSPAPVPPSPTARKPYGKDPLDRLAELGRLRDGGMVTPEEFAAAKAKILAED